MIGYASLLWGDESVVAVDDGVKTKKHRSRTGKPLLEQPPELRPMLPRSSRGPGPESAVSSIVVA